LDARNFKKANNILMVEKARVEACGATWCRWKQGKMKHGESIKVIDGKLSSSLI